MTARSWKIHIPVRPKAVQSVRATSRGFFADPKVRKWKDTIRPFIRAASPGTPTVLPLRIVSLKYTFAYPKSTPRRVRDYIDAGGIVPYIGCADITDNLAKGLIDTCAGIVFENDKQIWQMCTVSKVYGPTDSMDIEFEETPDVPMLDGSTGDPAQKARPGNLA